MKRKLLFAMLCIVSVFGAKAQTWTGNEPAAGEFYLYNVGADRFLDGGNSWGTQASLAEVGINCVLAAKESGYSISTTKSYANCYLGVNGYIDRPSGEACGWVFTAVDGLEKTYTINYNGTYLYWGGSGTALSVGTTAPTTANGYFKLVTATDRYNKISEATKTSSVDVSYMLGNPDFGRNSSTSMWTGTAPGLGGPNGDFVAEFFNKTFDMSQTITVPNGTYVASVYGYYRPGPYASLDNTTQNAFFYVNGMEKAFENIFTEAKTSKTGGWATSTDLGYIPNNTTNASDCFNAGGYKDNKLYVTITDGSMTIGLKKTEAVTNDWTCFDKIRIRYYGDCTIADVLGLELQELIDEAQTLVTNAPTYVSTTDLETAISAANTVMSTGTTEDDFSAGMTALQSAVDTYNAQFSLVSRYADIRTAALAINSALDTSATDAAAGAATTADEVNAAIATLRDAFAASLSSLTIPAAGYIDVTGVMVDNASVSTNTDYWTAEGTPNTNYSWGVCNYGECEFYQQNFKFYQTLSIATGTWEFGVTGFHRAGNHSTYFYAGDDKILIPGVESSVVNSMAQAKDYFDAGNGKVALKFLVETAGDIEIGIDNKDTETDKWTIFRDFTLKYYGAVDYSIYEDQWAELVANAATAKTTYPSVTGSELTALDAAVADAPDGSSKANYLEKIDALQTALQTFTAAASSYDAYVAYRAETAALFGEELAATVTAPTSAAEAATAVQTLNVAQYNKVASEYTYSLASKIGDFGTWTGTATVAGEAAEPNYLTNEHWSGATHAYYEQASTGWGNENGWTIKYEKTCTLPAGNYVIKVAARSSAGTSSTVSCSATSNVISLPNVGAASKGITTSGVASWAETDTYANNNTGYGWQWRYLPFTLDAETEVTMTFYAEASTLNQWMSIADADLLSDKDLTTKITLDEAADAASAIAAADGELATVTLTRNIKEGYNTFVVPFDMTSAQVQAVFGTGATVYTFSENSADANFAEINFAQSGEGTISANVPVLVQAVTASTENVIEGITIAAPAAAPAVAGTNVDFVGVYAPATVAAGDFFLSNANLYKSEGSNAIKAFRAYFDCQGATDVKLFIDGVATAIEAIDANKAETGVIYNVAGQRVGKAVRGLYIINGKKVLVK